jgi:hypothetical protein
MPSPRVGEDENTFISRCISKTLEDGTAQDEKQAYAICKNIYDMEAYSRKREKRINRLKAAIARRNERLKNEK